MHCVTCGRPLDVAVLHRYCSVSCALRELAAIALLLNTTPRHALNVAEWHDLSVDYATELEHLAQVTA
jgi:hypothetical protein